MIFNEEFREKIKQKAKTGEIGSTEDLQILLRDMTKEIIDILYNGELEEHLGYKKHEIKEKKTKNSRNGFSKKTVNSVYGKMELNVPRDREGSYEPKIVKKYQTDITGIENKILSMYALGMSTRDMQKHIYDIYPSTLLRTGGQDILPETVSRISDMVLESAKEWQSRPLDPIYTIAFMDALILKVRIEGVVKNVAIYCILAYGLQLAKKVDYVKKRLG